MRLFGMPAHNFVYLGSTQTFHEKPKVFNRFIITN
jgi:hypothetical protein